MGARARRCKALPRMQALTLEVIQRVIFGSRDPELRDALRAALDMTGSTADLIAMSLVQRDIGPYGRFLARRRAHRRAGLRRASTQRRRRRLDPRPAQGLRRDARGAARPARDAARRRPRDDRDRARLGARAARPPPVRDLDTDDAHRRVRQGGPAHPPGALASPPARRCSRTRSATTRSRRASTSRLPVPRAPPRGTTFARALPAPRAVHSSRSAAAPAAASAPRSPRWRCARCCERSPRGSRSRPERAEGERMRRRSVTLAPARGALDHPRPASVSRRDARHVLPP